MTDETPKPEVQPVMQQAQAVARVAPAEDVDSFMMPLFVSTIVVASIFSVAVDGLSKYYPETPRPGPSVTGKITAAPQ